MDMLELVADRQADLSTTADFLKKKVDRARAAVLILSIAGALAGAVAAASDIDGAARTAITTAGAACLALVAFLAGFFLSTEAVGRHIRARVASETLKREAFLHAAGAGDYVDPATRDDLLGKALELVDDQVRDLAGFLQERRGQGRCPRAALDRDTYLAARTDKQIDFYQDRVGRYRRKARRLHFWEWFLAAVAAVLAAVAGPLGRSDFDLAALTGVLTTVSGALLSHLQALKYDELVVSYSAAAERLKQLKARLKPADTVASIAERTEAILAEETGSWRALFVQ